MSSDQTLLGDTELIAPCGLNCGLCRAFVRDRNPCPGCRGGNIHKSNACVTCVIKNCGELAAGNYRFCFSCAKYPCSDLLHLDDRYRTKYGISVVANLGRIETIGVESFVTEEGAKWLCKKCGSRLCMHKPQCAACGHTWQSSNSGNQPPGDKTPNPAVNRTCAKSRAGRLP
jgi:hypothetical protein